MYLTQSDIEAALATIQRRSSAGSRLVVVYHAPAWVLGFVGIFLKRVGEPLRSAFSPQRMAALLARYGFDVLADSDFSAAFASLSPEIGAATRRVKHLRAVTAVKGSGRPGSPPR